MAPAAFEADILVSWFTDRTPKELQLFWPGHTRADRDRVFIAWLVIGAYVHAWFIVPFWVPTYVNWIVWASVAIGLAVWRGTHVSQ